jgi:hypothetical protein
MIDFLFFNMMEQSTFKSNYNLKVINLQNLKRCHYHIDLLIG